MSADGVHGPLESGEYWACERPESPPVDGIWWDEKCAACCVAYEAAAVLAPSFRVVTPNGSVPLAVDPIGTWHERWTPDELSIARARFYRSAR